MQVANPATVLGDFDDALFTYAGVTSRFFRRDGKFFVHTDGPDGRLADFEILYTFGVTPLQQYLVALPGGRLQALSIVWDARPKVKGGQRWYHLYPGEKIKAGDPLHWSARSQNWNSMCAACHSTGVRKGYDIATDAFSTTWSEINVGCEACHGPGEAHVTWAERATSAVGGSGDETKGLLRHFSNSTAGRWVFRPDGAIARWSGARRQDSETCFACHARRRQLVEPPVPGASFLDNYAPTLIEGDAYHPDGQIDGEVFEYGSFVQSKMYRAGVVCNDCHEPHGLKLRSAGNALCTSCHQAQVFDRPEHHRHSPSSTGAECVACHMPQKVYMGVDPRYDHSFRIPRPDLSQRFAVPNTCNACHRSESVAWAVSAIANWSSGERDAASFAAAFAAGQTGAVMAAPSLAELAGNQHREPFVRASALILLPHHPSAAAVDSVRLALDDEDALVRMAAARAGDLLPHRERGHLIGPLLDDPVRSVRIEAARVLADVSDEDLGEPLLKSRSRADEELIAAERASAEMPASHLNLAEFHVRGRRFQEAEHELKIVLRLDENSIAARVNLADVYRLTGREDDATRLLEDAIRLDPAAAEALHALGLLKVRQGEREQAVSLLGRAARAAPSNPRYSYVYAIALHEAGEFAEAIEVLEQAHQRACGDRMILRALLALEAKRGRTGAAAEYRKKLSELESLLSAR